MTTPTKTPAKKTAPKKAAAKKPAAKKRTAVPRPAATSSSTTALDALTAAAPAAVVEIPLDLIDPHPANPRTDLGDLTELVDSIKSHGVRQNLVLVPHPDEPARYRAVIGHRRRAAAALAGLATVPAVIDTTLDERAQLELMLLENVQRTDLTPVEEAQGYQGLLDLGATVADVARKVGRSRKTVEARLCLVALPERARDVVHTHQASLADAELLARTLARPEVQASPEIAERIEAAFGHPGFEHTLEREVREAETAAKIAALRDELTEAGVRVLHNPDNPLYAPDGFKSLSHLVPADAEPVHGSYHEIPDLTVEEHTPCPGHAAWISVNWDGPRAVYGCQDFKKHGHKDRWDSPRPSSSTPEIPRGELVAKNKASLAAEAVRRRWLTDHIKPGRRLDAGAVVYVATILRLAPNADYTVPGLMTNLFPELDNSGVRATPAGATLYLTALAAARVEARMPKDYWRDRPLDLIATHLSTLASWGYQLAEHEQEYVDKHLASVEERGA